MRCQYIVTETTQFFNDRLRNIFIGAMGFYRVVQAYETPVWRAFTPTVLTNGKFNHIGLPARAVSLWLTRRAKDEIRAARTTR